MSIENPNNNEMSKDELTMEQDQEKPKKKSKNLEIASPTQLSIKNRSDNHLQPFEVSAPITVIENINQYQNIINTVKNMLDHDNFEIKSNKNKTMIYKKNLTNYEKLLQKFNEVNI